MGKSPERVQLESKDLAAEKLAALEELFPGVVADGVLDAARIGELVGLDVAGLKDGRERYGLMWAGKQDAVQALLEPSRATLVPDVKDSVNFDSAENVFIEGDNFEVLKLLQKAYNDQVKLIYIDPPYNTGNDFVYNDDFGDPLRRYLEYTGQIDADGNRVAANVDASGRRHSSWLSMMFPRLVLARNLLSQDGVLLCSISDIEFANVRLMLDEIFGPENFVASFIWNNDGNIEQQSAVKANHEFILCFARNIAELEKPGVIDPNIAEDSKLFNSEIENSITKNGPKNPPSTVTLPAGFPAAEQEFRVEPRSGKQPEIVDPIVVEGGRLVSPAALSSGWSSRRLLDLFIANRFVPIEDSEGKETRFAVTKTGAIYGYKKRSDSQGHVLTVLRNMGTTKATSSFLSREWGVEFDFPKPEKLIQYLVSVFSSSSDVVMDFFAGSGTTAHAVALQNLEDGQSRRCVSVNLPERVADESSAAKAGFKSVSDVTKARLKAVIKSVAGAKQQGLRIFTLGESNFEIASQPQDRQLQLGESTLRHQDFDVHSVAAEILVKEGVRLDLPWEWLDLAGATSLKVGELVAVLSTEITEEVVQAALDAAPRVLVFLEDGFAGRDAAKASAHFGCKQAQITMKTV